MKLSKPSIIFLNGPETPVKQNLVANLRDRFNENACITINRKNLLTMFNGYKDTCDESHEWIISKILKNVLNNGVFVIFDGFLPSRRIKQYVDNMKGLPCYWIGVFFKESDNEFYDFSVQLKGEIDTECMLNSIPFCKNLSFDDIDITDNTNSDESVEEELEINEASLKIFNFIANNDPKYFQSFRSVEHVARKRMKDSDARFSTDDFEIDNDMNAQIEKNSNASNDKFETFNRLNEKRSSKSSFGRSRFNNNNRSSEFGGRNFASRRIDTKEREGEDNSKEKKEEFRSNRFGRERSSYGRTNQFERKRTFEPSRQFRNNFNTPKERTDDFKIRQQSKEQEDKRTFGERREGFRSNRFGRERSSFKKANRFEEKKENSNYSSRFRDSNELSEKKSNGFDRTRKNMNRSYGDKSKRFNK